MPQGYGSAVHKLRYRVGMQIIVVCGQRNAQLASTKWSEVDCSRCLARRPARNPTATASRRTAIDTRRVRPRRRRNPGFTDDPLVVLAAVGAMYWLFFRPDAQAGAALL